MPLDDVTLRIDPVAQRVLAALLAMIMYTVALGLTVEDFRRIARRPGLVLWGVTLQLVALPVATFFASFLAPTASVALGMIVVAACPGGSVSNFLTMSARGDTALSVSMTAVTSALAAITTPFHIVWWASLQPRTRALLDALGIDPGLFVLQTVLLLGVPLVLGMVTARLAPAFARRSMPPLRWASFGALWVFVVGAIAANAEHLGRFAATVMPVVVGHNALALALGWVGGRLAGAGPAVTRALTIEVGIQNSGLGLVILLQQFSGLGGAALVTAGWGFWHLVTGMALTLAWGRPSIRRATHDE